VEGLKHFCKKIVFDYFWQMVDQIDSKQVRKLSLEDKARILSWREEGVLVTAIANRLGRYLSSIIRFLVQVQAPPTLSLPGKRAQGNLMSSKSLP
jgi:hypothetical protein